MNNGDIKLVGLIGWPVKHSLSPVIHNSAFEDLDINWRYIPFAVHPSKVSIAVKGLAALGFRGVNVTAPHKQSVMASLTWIAQDAARIGAVNTLVFGGPEDAETEVCGHNTDKPGFINALLEGGFRLQKDHQVLIIGAGGAARAVIYSLLEVGVDKIYILNRSLERGLKLIKDFSNLTIGKNQLHIFPLDSKTILKYANCANLLVNTTPVGTWPNCNISIWPENMSIPSHLTIFDLVYNPIETQLLKQARISQVSVISGLEMLIQQAALAFELWTGASAPLNAMRTAAKAALKMAI
jgi:shikimate dehydrogenase